ncbi:MAG: DUF1349 domain-containing protein, partial [Gracilibacteraceae bacterium]|nr:DUF1349 domain-containing protein [Gracilibacteraceae bacterium]
MFLKSSKKTRVCFVFLLACAVFLSVLCYTPEAVAAEALKVGPQWRIEKDNPQKYTLESDTRISIQGGSGDLYNTTNTAENIFLTDVYEEDYEFQTKLTFRPENNYQAAGLIVYLGEDDYLALLRRYHTGYKVNGSGNCIQFISEEDKICTENGQIADIYAETIYLKIKKEGTTYTGSVSSDGLSWTDLLTTRTNPSVTNSPETKVGFLSKGFPSDTEHYLIWEDFTVKNTINDTFRVVPYSSQWRVEYEQPEKYTLDSSTKLTAQGGQGDLYQATNNAEN